MLEEIGSYDDRTGGKADVRNRVACIEHNESIGGFVNAAGLDVCVCIKNVRTMRKIIRERRGSINRKLTSTTYGNDEDIDLDSREL